MSISYSGNLFEHFNFTRKIPQIFSSLVSNFLPFQLPEKKNLRIQSKITPFLFTRKISPKRIHFQKLEIGSFWFRRHC